MNSHLNKITTIFRPLLIILVYLLLIDGCVFLPPIDSPPSPEKNQPVHFVGPNGKLSAQQSTAVIDKLKRESNSTDILDRHIAAEEALVGRPLVLGNRVTLLQDGPTTYQSMFAAIRVAKDHINLETYIFEDDEIGIRFADLLLEKQAQGVQVNLIYDSVGTIGTSRDFFKRLSDGGINTLEFNPVNPLSVRDEWLLDHRDHRKLMIVDGSVAFVGGINISSVYSHGSFSKGTRKDAKSGKGWRDTHTRIEGPAVREFQKYFMETWEKQKGAALAPRNYFPSVNKKGDDIVRAIESRADDPYNAIYATLLSAISSAESHIYITNAYFVPDPQFIQALKDAARRGIDVRLILPSRTDAWLVFHAGRSHYTDLLKAGVKIYERKSTVLHSKTVVVDDVWSSIGSTNLDWRSFVHNDELNAVILGREFTTQMRSMFDKDLLESTPILLADWKRRSPLLHLKEFMARMWEYWL